MDKLLKQLIKFIGISGIGWILDFITYTILAIITKNIFISNVIGAFAGITFVFYFSTKHIFENTNSISIKKKYFLYIIYQILLLYFISKLLVNIENLLSIYVVKQFSIILSKLIITPITMLLNFIVLKRII